MTVFSLACGGVRSASTPGEGCAEINALLERASRGEIAAAGSATMDVNQYRVRGRFTLFVSKAGDVTLEYTSSGVMGGGREDVVFAYHSDTLRVLDREHGEYYEGGEVVELVAGATEAAFDVAELVRRATSQPLDCDEVLYEASGPAGGEGRWRDGPFSIRVDPVTGRPVASRWHFGSLDEVVEISYRWDGDRLAELTVAVPARRWRLRLDV